MKFVIQVNSSPFHGRAAHTAHQFIRAALAEGHAIVRTFFYHDGVFAGFAVSRPGEEIGVNPPDWAGLAREHGIDLVLCVSAAERRGLRTEKQPGGRENQRAPAEGFRVGGLGQWVEACLEADRVLVFGD